MPTALATTKELQRLRPRMAILPLGATEQHGPHLPLATDILIMEAIAQRVAERLRAYGSPSLPFSVSHMHRGQCGTIWLRNATVAQLIRDVASSGLAPTTFSNWHVDPAPAPGAFADGHVAMVRFSGYLKDYKFPPAVNPIYSGVTCP